MLKSQQLGGGIPLRMPFSPERNFNYARPIGIDNRTTAFTNIPIELNFNSNNFDFSVPKSDGSDIRFKDVNRKLLPYWIESWDISTKIGKIWVLIPEMDDYEFRIIWIFFDNPNAISQSSPDNTYDRGLLNNYSFETTISDSDWTFGGTNCKYLYQSQTDWKIHGSYSIKLKTYIGGGNSHSYHAYLTQTIQGPFELLVDMKTGAFAGSGDSYARIYVDADLEWNTYSQNTEFLNHKIIVDDSNSHALKLQCGFGAGSPGRSAIFSIDNIRAKKYLSTMPLITFL